MNRLTRYNVMVLDHFEHPRNVGVVDRPDADAWVSNEQCGDTLRLTLRIDRGVIRDARFKALGCVAAIAAGSRLTEMLIGRSLHEAASISNESVAASLGGLPPEKVGCSVLAEEAVVAALANHQQRQRCEGGDGGPLPGSRGCGDERARIPGYPALPDP